MNKNKSNISIVLFITLIFRFGTGFTVSAATSYSNVIAWGDNYYGQTNVPIGLTDVIAIAGGAAHTVALKENGTVVTWGVSINILPAKPLIVPDGLVNVKAIASGASHAVALKEDGTVVAWGDNYYGQTNVPAGLTNVKAIDARGVHTVALKEDGTVVAWGSISIASKFSETMVPDTVPVGIANVKAIAAGGNYTVVLKEDGTAVAWGDNYYGQTNVPTGLTNIKAIDAGNLHTIALKEDGTMVTWGKIFAGMTLDPATVPSGLANVKDIASGEDHIVVLKEDGIVLAWGYNGYGQTNVPAGLTNVKDIAAGYNHTLALLPILTGIEITTPPKKTEYVVGQSLDLTGIVVTGTYNNGTTEPITITTENISGFDSSAPVLGQTVTVTVDSKIATFNVNIIEKYTVTFYSNGGSEVPSQIVDYNTIFTEPTTPTRTRYTFGGWYKEAACENAWDFTKDTVTTDTTLYAKWTINSYTVSFDSQGGSNVTSKTVDHNTLITAPAAPTKTGYIFEGWYQEAGSINEWDFATNKVTENTTLYAKWTDICDIDKDGTVSILDVASVAKNYNINNTDVNWNSQFDFNNDGIVDIFDLVISSKRISKY